MEVGIIQLNICVGIIRTWWR